MDKINNLAYDYSAYDEEEVVAARKINHKTNPKKKKKSGIKSLLVVGVVVALSSAMIYGKVEISSLNSDLSERQAEYTQLNNENVSFESELAQKTGLTKVEEYAENELGLVKLVKSQIEYVEVEGETVAEVVVPEETNVFVKIKRWFSDVLEYIGA